MSALADFARAEDFDRAVLTFKRAANIIRKQADQALSGEVDPALFENDAEQQFWQTLGRVEPIWDELARHADYSRMLGQLRELRPAVDGFFDGVMVMCDDSRVRANRLNMLYRLVSILGRVADFGRLQV